jgi:YVTN family beta-propeller protein
MAVDCQPKSPEERHWGRHSSKKMSFARTMHFPSLSRHFAFALFAALIANRAILAASTEAKPLLLVVNQGDASLSFVDPASNRQVAVLQEGIPQMVAHEVTTSPDGRIAYLPLYGDSGVGRPGTNGQLILLIDLEKRAITDRIDLGHGVRPHCILYDGKSGLLYVTTEIEKAVTVIDPRTRTVVGAIPTGEEQSHMLVISHDSRFGYTANVAAGTVSVLDLIHLKLVKKIAIAPETQRIAISNDDRMVFTSDQTKPRMAVIDTGTNEIAHWIELPAPGYGSAPTKDGRLLLVTLPTANQLAVVDLKTFKVLRTIKVGEKPQEVLVRPDGKVAYVSSFNGHDVRVIDLASWRVSATIDVGPKADGMGWSGE